VLELNFGKSASVLLWM